ncbi:hypothetical protein LCGC14_2239050 [marine sediment metagenome]|uniref:Uncharacterized protein n=1 Tax=marine sediment metagenome TaxID=412755 RepID=A0A0F9D659_9ZZZZ
MTHAMGTRQGRSLTELAPMGRGYRRAGGADAVGGRGSRQRLHDSRLPGHPQVVVPGEVRPARLLEHPQFAHLLTLLTVTLGRYADRLSPGCGPRNPTVAPRAGRSADSAVSLLTSPGRSDTFCRSQQQALIVWGVPEAALSGVGEPVAAARPGLRSGHRRRLDALISPHRGVSLRPAVTITRWCNW